MDLPAAKGGGHEWPRRKHEEYRDLPVAIERQATDHTDQHGFIFKLDVMPYLLSGFSNSRWFNPCISVKSVATILPQANPCIF